MSSLVLSWVRLGSGVREGAAENVIDRTIKREVLTTSATSTTSAVAPEGANACVVYAVDANHAVYHDYTGAGIAATAATGADVRTGAKEVIAVKAGTSKISALTF